MHPHLLLVRGAAKGIRRGCKRDFLNLDKVTRVSRCCGAFLGLYQGLHGNAQTASIDQVHLGLAKVSSERVQGLGLSGNIVQLVALLQVSAQDGDRFRVASQAVFPRKNSPNQARFAGIRGMWCSGPCGDRHFLAWNWRALEK